MSQLEKSKKVTPTPTTMEKVAEATPYITTSAAITLLLTYFFELPTDVATALTVVVFALVNYLAIFVKQLIKEVR